MANQQLDNNQTTGGPHCRGDAAYYEPRVSVTLLWRKGPPLYSNTLMLPIREEHLKGTVVGIACVTGAKGLGANAKHNGFRHGVFYVSFSALLYFDLHGFKYPSDCRLLSINQDRRSQL